MGWRALVVVVAARSGGSLVPHLYRRGRFLQGDALPVSGELPFCHAFASGPGTLLPLAHHTTFNRQIGLVTSALV